MAQYFNLKRNQERLAALRMQVSELDREARRAIPIVARHFALAPQNVQLLKWEVSASFQAKRNVVAIARSLEPYREKAQ